MPPTIPGAKNPTVNKTDVCPALWGHELGTKGRRRKEMVAKEGKLLVKTRGIEGKDCAPIVPVQIPDSQVQQLPAGSVVGPGDH